MATHAERSLAGDEWASNNPQEAQQQTLIANAVLRKLIEISRATGRIPNVGSVMTKREELNQSDEASRQHPILR